MKGKLIGFNIALIFIVLVLVSCKMDNQIPNDQHVDIRDRIEEDINNGVLNRSNLSLDESNLPDKKYVADKDHSSIRFRTKHWEIVDIIGWFADFEIVMYSDNPDFSDAVIFGRVFPNSILMPNSKMTGSAQNPPYINAEEYPEMTFLSTEMKLIRENNYELFGSLQVNGIKKEMAFDVVFNGFAYPNEKSICGFDVRGKINRNDFGIGGNGKLHSGKIIHNDTIHLRMALRME